MRIASIQLDLRDGRTKEETVRYALSMMSSAKGADLIVLPELWNIGFTAYDRYWSESETISGYTSRAVGDMARELGAYVYSGSFVESRGGNYYNTAVLFDRMGNLIGSYSKIHLFSYKSREPELLSPGTEISVVDTEFGRMGLSICYDLRFPELYRRMVDMGAEFFLVSACWPFPRLEAWEIFNRARAAENECFLVSSNAAGAQSGVLLMGHSMIVDPWGTVIAGSAYREAIVTADVDPNAVKLARASFPVLEDRALK
jgi:predicted amidohydrolase